MADNAIPEVANRTPFEPRRPIAKQRTLDATASVSAPPCVIVKSVERGDEKPVLVAVKISPIRRTAIATGHISAGDAGLAKEIIRITIAAGNEGAAQVSNITVLTKSIGP